MGVFLVVLALAGAEPAMLAQPELDAISAKCHSPRKWLKNIGGEIHIRPSRTADYKQVDCVLAALRRTNAGPLGFIGNEAYNPNETPR
jgi:hypothetical protein